MKLIFASIAIAMQAVAGCQELTHREYYEPTDVHLVEIDGRHYGPVKVETTRTGVPDWSEGKALNVSAVK